MAYEIVNMLIDYELLIARLYGKCSEKFPELNDFFKELAREEVKHADTIKEILGQVDDSNIRVNARRFNKRPLEISMEHVEEIIGRLDTDDLDLLRALSLAYDLEQSTIESKYYEVFTGRTSDFNNRLRQVRDESRKHAQLIRTKKQEVYEGR